MQDKPKPVPGFFHQAICLIFFVVSTLEPINWTAVSVWAAAAIIIDIICSIERERRESETKQ